MTPLALVLAAGPLMVPRPGGSGWNRFEVLGLGAGKLAVRELTLGDAEGALCTYPGLKTGEGAVLHLWSLPPPRSAALATGARGVVYQGGAADAGCTPEPLAKAELSRMKAAFADAGLSLSPAPATAELSEAQLTEGAFSGSCYRARGCTLRRSVPLGGSPLELELRLNADSPCGDPPEPGCQLTRRYRGTLKHRETAAAFDLVTAPTGDNRQFVLTGIAAAASPDATVAVISFAWCYVSCREKVPVLLRLR